MKIALVHDQLQEFGGAERVLVALKEIFPQADVYTSFYNPRTLGVHREKFNDWRIFTSWADKIPFLKRMYSPLRFMTPLIWEGFDFSGYDLVISSSGSYMSKGVVTRPETVHICYLHHPPRYLYYYETAIEWQKYRLIKIYGNLINHNLRLWDYLSSQRVDFFIANSEETKKRIKKFYRREAEVVYPPVNIPKRLEESNPHLSDRSYYITLSRLARAKHIEVLIRSANKYKFRLKIIGRGRDERYLKSLAGPTVEFLGELADKEVGKFYNRARGFLFSAVDEEFGIAVVEAMGYGLPVIAFASGGVKEIVNNKNGFLYHRLDERAVIEQINRLEKLPEEEYLRLRQEARRSVERYSRSGFKKRIKGVVDQLINLYKKNA